MLPVLEKLLVLQDRDTRRARLKAELARFPSQSAALDQRVKEESTKLEQMRDQLKHLEADRKKLEIEAESGRGQILKWRGQLSQIKSNTEYQALLKEIGKSEAEIKGIEDRELELMERFEALQPVMREEQSLVKDATARAGTEKVELERRTAAIEKELAELDAMRAQVAKEIDPAVLGRYDRLLRSKGDLAVVPVKHGNCGGCHLQVPTHLTHAAKNGEDLVSCTQCGRILYCAE
jgi:predicted  nucleic acid-binding Zn-ribbon protein